MYSLIFFEAAVTIEVFLNTVSTWIQSKYAKKRLSGKLQALEDKLKEKQPNSTIENLIWKILQTERIYYITMLVLILILFVYDSIQYIINGVQLLQHCIQYVINKIR